jgi:uncharacterized protein involved in response to NO
VETPSPPTAMPSRETYRAPQSVVRAIRFIFVGAALNVIYLLVYIASLDAVRHGIERNHPRYSAHQIESAMNSDIGFQLGFTTAVVGVWLLVAWGVWTGSKTARIAATVFLGLKTIVLVDHFIHFQPTGAVLESALTWLVGVRCVLLLWADESNDYF